MWFWALTRKENMVALEVWDASKRGLLKTLKDLANEKREIVKTLLKKNHRIFLCGVALHISILGGKVERHYHPMSGLT